MSDEERIQTRLGDDRIDIAIDPPQRSPFDASKKVEKLAVSVRWLPSGDTPESVTPSRTGGGFEFAIGEKRFVYDRLGAAPTLGRHSPNGQRPRVCGGACLR